MLQLVYITVGQYDCMLQYSAFIDRKNMIINVHRGLTTNAMQPLEVISKYLLLRCVGCVTCILCIYKTASCVDKRRLGSCIQCGKAELHKHTHNFIA